MPISLSPLMMRQIIMDHYEHPHNKRTVDDERYKKVHMDSSSCIDDIYIYVLIENNIIKDVAFDGIACTIATASTSMMTDLLIGKTVEQADYIFDNYMKMITEQPFDESCIDEAIVFINTSKQASRIKCATIGWRGFRCAVTGEEDKFNG